MEFKSDKYRVVIKYAKSGQGLRIEWYSPGECCRKDTSGTTDAWFSESGESGTPCD